jgi:membrane-associated HD superfamily phosphohydrolase
LTEGNILEKDRFAESKTLYISGMIALFLSLIFFSISLYILPFTIWGIVYSVPSFIPNISVHLEQVHGFSIGQSHFIILVVLFLLGVLFGVIAFLFSYFIERNMFTQKSSSTERTKISGDNSIVSDGGGFKFIIKLLILIIIMLVIVFSTHWLISTPTPN